jgi:hypothetical protein
MLHQIVRDQPDVPAPPGSTTWAGIIIARSMGVAHQLGPPACAYCGARVNEKHDVRCEKGFALAGIWSPSSSRMPSAAELIEWQNRVLDDLHDVRAEFTRLRAYVELRERDAAALSKQATALYEDNQRLRAELDTLKSLHKNCLVGAAVEIIKRHRSEARDALDKMTRWIAAIPSTDVRDTKFELERRAHVARAMDVLRPACVVRDFYATTTAPRARVAKLAKITDPESATVDGGLSLQVDELRREFDWSKEQ